MREGSRNKKSEQSVGNILLSWQHIIIFPENDV